MQFVSQPHRLWSSMEDFPSTQSSLAEWRTRLATDFESVQTLLRPAEHDEGCYQLDLKAIAKEVAAALKITFALVELSSSPLTWRLGQLEIGNGTSTSVHLSIPVESEDLRRSIQMVVFDQRFAGLVIAPTRRHHQSSFDAFVKANSGCFGALSNLLTARIHDRWTVNDNAVETMQMVLAGMRRPPDDAMNQRTREVSLAMLELGAVSADKRRPVEEIVVKAFGEEAAAISLKSLMREMKARDFVESKLGPRGGYWLSAKGLERANRLKSA